MSDWIDKLSNDAQLVEAQTTARAADALAADKAIRAEIPEYLRLLEMEIRDIRRKFSEKPNLCISLSVTDDSDPEVESRLRVEVVLDVYGRLESTHTLIYHGIGQKFLRCYTLEGTASVLRFAVRSSDWMVGLYVENGKGELMTPAQAAQYIVKPMVKQVREKA